MTSRERDIEEYAKLRYVEMEPEKSKEIWNQIESSVSSASASSLTKGAHKWWATIGIASATCVVIAGGILVGKNYLDGNGVTHSTTTHDTQASLAKAVEASSKDWRVILVKSLLKPGPYYDMNIYYKGKQSIQVTQFKLTWGGSATGTGTVSLKPGSYLGGFSSVSVRSGFKKLNPLKVSWVEGSPWVNPKSYSERIDLSKAKPDLKVENYHKYTGHSDKWNVSYAYETIIGKNLKHSYGTLVLQYKGKQIGKKISYTLTSNTGTQHYSYVNPIGSSVRRHVTPTRKGYDIKATTAKITIQWKGKTETVTLKRQ